METQQFKVNWWQANNGKQASITQFFGPVVQNNIDTKSSALSYSLMALGLDAPFNTDVGFNNSRGFNKLIHLGIEEFANLSISVSFVAAVR